MHLVICSFLKLIEKIQKNKVIRVNHFVNTSKNNLPAQP